MSVLIKGLEMPETGYMDVRIFRDGTAAIAIGTKPYYRELKAEPVRHAKNIGTDYDEVDQFVCSECGIELQGWYRVEHDEDDGEETYHEYRFRCCPNCGTRIEQ